MELTRSRVQRRFGIAATTIGLSLAALAAATPLALAAITQAPVLGAPSGGEQITSFGPTLQWTLPSGSTQYHLQVIPFGNDGPGVNVTGNAAESFALPSPPEWYGLLPDMSYSWRVRSTDATTSVSEDDASWGPWSSAGSFRTPSVAAASVTPFAPVNGGVVGNLTPVLTWASSTDNIYYWEVQVSKDPGFGTEAFLYSELRHGGVTVPTNSYQIPSAFPLEPGTSYFWRVRPRVQGDGTTLPWPASSSFRTPAPGKLSLTVSSPADQQVVNSRNVTITGTAKPGALVVVGTAFTTARSDGGFTLTATLVEGINELDINAFDLATGERVSLTLTVTYFP